MPPFLEFIIIVVFGVLGHSINAIVALLFIDLSIKYHRSIMQRNALRSALNWFCHFDSTRIKYRNYEDKASFLSNYFYKCLIEIQYSTFNLCPFVTNTEFREILAINEDELTDLHERARTRHLSGIGMSDVEIDMWLGVVRTHLTSEPATFKEIFKAFIKNPSKYLTLRSLK